MANIASLGASAPVLAVTNGIPTTTSLNVAAFFQKRHDHVLRDIENLTAQLDEKHRLPNFGETVIDRPNPSGGAPIKSPAYTLTRGGSLLDLHSNPGIMLHKEPDNSDAKRHPHPKDWRFFCARARSMAGRATDTTPARGRSPLGFARVISLLAASPDAPDNVPARIFKVSQRSVHHV